MAESAKFAKFEHLSSYSAAETLGADDLERVTFYPKKGWFITRWQATVLSVAVVLVIFVAIYANKAADDDGSLPGFPDDRFLRYIYHKNVSDTLHVLPSLGKDSRTTENFGNSLNEELLKYLIEPTHYNITLKSLPNFRSIISREYDFDGEVYIHLRCRENIDYILIGISELNNIKIRMIRRTSYNEVKASRTEESPHEIEITKIVHFEGIMRIDFGEPLEPFKTYEMRIKYQGYVRSLPYGLFYFANRDSESLQESLLIGTNTDTPFARTIFPCFDARQQNATYEISIPLNTGMHFESSILRWELEETK